MHPGYQHQVVKRGANHGLHLALSICTCGVWAVTGWPIAALIGRRQTVTTYGGAPQTPYPPQQLPPTAYPPQGQYGPPPGHQQTPPHGWQQPPTT
ncbi:hypothetical protein [Streptomyces sp. NPDC088733]|uniref:hypothetical protein n=1 Tax=Streptomyces sp. NPDC088733 TaxID=3365880 RepID=UPI0037FD6C3F